MTESLVVEVTYLDSGISVLGDIKSMRQATEILVGIVKGGTITRPNGDVVFYNMRHIKKIKIITKGKKDGL